MGVYNIKFTAPYIKWQIVKQVAKTTAIIFFLSNAKRINERQGGSVKDNITSELVMPL